MTTKRRESEQERNREIDENVFSLTGKTEAQIIRNGTPLEKACLLLQNYEAYLHGQHYNLTGEQKKALMDNNTPTQRRDYQMYIRLYDALTYFWLFILVDETRSAESCLSELCGFLHMYDLMDKAEKKGIQIGEKLEKETAFSLAKEKADLLKRRFGRVKAAAQYIRDFVGNKIDIVKFVMPCSYELCAVFEDKMEECFFGKDSEIDILTLFPLDDKYYKAKSKGREAVIPDYKAVKINKQFYMDAKKRHEDEIRKRANKNN